MVTLVIPTPTTYTLGLDIFYLAIELCIGAIIDWKKKELYVWVIKMFSYKIKSKLDGRRTTTSCSVDSGKSAMTGLRWNTAISNGQQFDEHVLISDIVIIYAYIDDMEMWNCFLHSTPNRPSIALAARWRQRLVVKS